MTNAYHKPVLLAASINGLEVQPNGIYVDATFGGGGHTKALLKKMGAEARLFAFDQDTDAKVNRVEDGRLTFIEANFRHLQQYLKYYGVMKVNGIIADFGVSSFQLDEATRGFSMRYDARLDMRMNTHQELDAHALVNTYSEAQLADVFFHFGELKNARQIARKICAERMVQKIQTTFQLKEVLKPLIPTRYENKMLARIFQAIRIEVNNELGSLKDFLQQATAVLKQGGRLACISYHSLEDRLVKRFIQSGNFEGNVEKDFYGNKKVPLKSIGKLIVPDEAEIKKNNRARSARLRIAEKIDSLSTP